MAPKNVGEEQEQQERELGIPPVVTPPSEDANNPVIQDGSVCIFNGLIESLPEPPSGRVLYLTRHGESMYNLDQRIGGNPSLSPRGIKYATCLSHHVNNMQIPGLKVWTSTLTRTHQTAKNLDAPKEEKNALDEMGSKQFDHLTYKQLEERYPEMFRAREEDKLNFRYPGEGGESYVDVCKRLENILPEMDSSHNLLVVAHQAVIRCLFSFFFRTPAERMPYDKIPLHTLMKITWDSASGKNNIEMQSFGIEAVDTHRPKADSKADQAKSPAKTPSPTKRSFHQSLESTGDKMIA